MNDSFINALNTQAATNHWIEGIGENMMNCYTPGYRENKINFRTYLGGIAPDSLLKSTGQGKSTPGTSDENVFLEGKGFFVIKNEHGKTSYTRLGEFKFDGEGVYKTADGKRVQGYILNDKGEIMQGTKPMDADIFTESTLNGGSVQIPTTDIKLWIDPGNGKYLGKFDEFKIEQDGIVYGKADKGKVKTPLYKIAIMNFHNPQELFEIKPGQFIETEESGKPVASTGEVRGGLIELSNSSLGGNINIYKMAQTQWSVTNKLVQTNKQLLQEAIDLMSS
ncbi:MAG: hypothetical protein ACI37Z_05545 [Candidatus Gastranaerophilaceae bacterium]